MNKVFLIGNLTRDPELTETANAVSVCHFSIAVNRNYTDGNGERQTDFFNVTAWRGLADNVAKFCKKGSKVAVSGSVQIRNYEDNNGNKRTAVDIIAQEVEFLTQKQNEGEDFYQGRSAGTRKEKPKLEAFDDGDIPF